ncbi:MAG: T9SS type A sorting domain-containing protein [Candidatus Marinimicrobia bacterium]|nr:T9SS type A sorting domain-containing protein [Candidatus Neomarinimicrobiota bacterium]MCF7827432.1 T9SS type A sorting domain-containing protein [Candidatus Neomarinimicrobiota bacterium]MCF7881335.1 T9SS type A sorting domain-containing protein [Candidatus Neomarinimicrobiota bacterium]
MKRCIRLCGLVLLLLSGPTVQAEWTNQILVADSIEVLSRPIVVENFERSVDTAVVLFEGRTTRHISDIFLGKFWFENEELALEVLNISQSTDSSYFPQYHGKWDSEYMAVIWLEMNKSTSDSMLMLLRKISSDGGWLQPDSVQWFSGLDEYRIFNTPWGNTNQVTFTYTTYQDSFFYEFRYDLTENQVLNSDTIIFAEDEFRTPRIQDFKFATLWGGDIPDYQVVALVETESSMSVSTTYYQRGFCFVGCTEPYWGDLVPHATVNSNTSEIQVVQGFGLQPRAGWLVSDGSKNYAAILISEDCFDSTMWGPHQGWSAWTSVVKIPLIGDNSAHLTLGYPDKNNMLIAWDAEYRGNREIFVKCASSEERPVRVTKNSGADITPVIAHIRSGLDAYEVVILWNSDHTGVPRLWAATGSVPVEVQDESRIPEIFHVSQNYPNPFNTETTIEYTVPTPGEINAGVYNLLGQKVETLHNARVDAGRHSLRWDGESDAGPSVASGVYLVRIRYKIADQPSVVVKTLRVVLMK